MLPFHIQDIQSCIILPWYIQNIPQYPKYDIGLRSLNLAIIQLVNACNIPNFGPTIYRHEPIDHDVYIDVLFLYWVKDPTAYEHDDLLCILGLSQLMMIYVYICQFCWAWNLKHMIDEIFCVGNGP